MDATSEFTAPMEDMAAGMGTEMGYGETPSVGATEKETVEDGGENPSSMTKRVPEYFKLLGEKMERDKYFELLCECFKICVYLKLSGGSQVEGISAIDFINKTYGVLLAPKVWKHFLEPEEKNLLYSLITGNLHAFSSKQQKRLMARMTEVFPSHGHGGGGSTRSGGKCPIGYHLNTEVMELPVSVAINRTVQCEMDSNGVKESDAVCKVTTKVQLPSSFASGNPGAPLNEDSGANAQCAQAFGDSSSKQPAVVYDIQCNVYGETAAKLAAALTKNSQLPILPIQLPPIEVSCTYNFVGLGGDCIQASDVGRQNNMPSIKNSTDGSGRERGNRQSVKRKRPKKKQKQNGMANQALNGTSATEQKPDSICESSTGAMHTEEDRVDLLEEHEDV